MNDKYAEAVKAAQHGSLKYGLSGVDLGTVIGKEQDTLEGLLSQLYDITYDNREALVNLRMAYLGPWPEPAMPSGEIGPPSSGMIDTMKNKIRSMIEFNRNIREHIAVISKEVR